MIPNIQLYILKKNWTVSLHCGIARDNQLDLSLSENSAVGRQRPLPLVCGDHGMGWWWGLGGAQEGERVLTVLPLHLTPKHTLSLRDMMHRDVENAQRWRKMHRENAKSYRQCTDM